MPARRPASDDPSLLIPVRKRRPLPGSFSWPDTVRLTSCRDADRLPLEQISVELKRNSASRSASIEIFPY